MLPDLRVWTKLRTLGHATEADNYGCRALGGSSKQRSTAIWAERLSHLLPALHESVTLGLAGQLELPDWRGDYGSKGGSRQDLAIGAMANRHPHRIYLGRK
jgi:hypothetical protein